MFQALLVIAVLCMVVWLYLKWLRLKQYWAIRGVPNVPVYPLLGSLTFLTRCNPAIWMRNVYEKFDSPYVGMWVFFRPAIIINDPEIARNILIKDAANFRDRFVSSGPTDPIGYLNLFTVKCLSFNTGEVEANFLKREGVKITRIPRRACMKKMMNLKEAKEEPLWSSLRRRLTLVFTSAKLKRVNEIMKVKSQELVRRIEMEMKKNKRVELRTMVTDYTTDVIGVSSFGIASDATLTGESHLRTVTKELMKFSLHRSLSWVSMFFYPELVDTFGFSAAPKHIVEYFRRIFRTAVTQRGGYDIHIKENRDLLDALIKLKQDCVKNNEDISEDTLVAQASVFVLGGFDTTGSILSYCLYELAFDSEIQNRVYKEIIDEKNKYGDTAFDVNNFSTLKYMDCVINETLRKYVPMGWLDRVAARDYQLDGRVTITAGTPVYINFVGMHYDPKFYSEPKRFNPDRFLSINEENTKVFAPFGVGPRSCIGRRFAMVNLRNALTSILLAYEVRALPNTPTPSESAIAVKNFFIIPGEPLLVQFVPRSNNIE